MRHEFHDINEVAAQDGAWFVYLLYSYECSAFKIGFTCNPLQRMYSFNRRYFERFDLAQSLLLQLQCCEEARDVEAALKKTFAPFRTECPAWVAEEAGGHTEWFSEVSVREAVESIRSYASSHSGTRLIVASDHVRAELRRVSSSFEIWAWRQAQQVCEAGTHFSGRRLQIESARALRDWLEAYRHFNIELFDADKDVAHFVTQCALA